MRHFVLTSLRRKEGRMGMELLHCGWRALDLLAPYPHHLLIHVLSSSEPSIEPGHEEPTEPCMRPAYEPGEEDLEAAMALLLQRRLPFPPYLGEATVLSTSTTLKAAAEVLFSSLLLQILSSSPPSQRGCFYALVARNSVLHLIAWQTRFHYHFRACAWPTGTLPRPCTACYYLRARQTLPACVRATAL